MPFPKFIAAPNSHVWFGGLDGDLVHSNWDNCFKSIVTGEWGVKSDGDVEAPSGYFALVEVPLNLRERADMVDACRNNFDNDEDWFTIEPGWYITSENNQGLIYVWKMPDKSAAEICYDGLQREYSRWSSEVEADSEPPSVGFVP
jgi:hypothetical protein